LESGKRGVQVECSNTAACVCVRAGVSCLLCYILIVFIPYTYIYIYLGTPTIPTKAHSSRWRMHSSQARTSKLTNTGLKFFKKKNKKKTKKRNRYRELVDVALVPNCSHHSEKKITSMESNIHV